MRRRLQTPIYVCPSSRFGAVPPPSIGPDGTLALARGLHDGSEQVALRPPGALEWRREVAGTHLGHDFYYPFLALDDSGVFLAAGHGFVDG